MATKAAIGKTKVTDIPLDEEQVDDLDEAAEIIPCTYSITSYGADYPVDGLVKRIEAKDILVPKFSWSGSKKKSEIVGFQREYVWPRPKADRFIESLLLGLPVPGIFLVKEQSGRLLAGCGKRVFRRSKRPISALVQRRINNLRTLVSDLVGGPETFSAAC